MKTKSAKAAPKSPQTKTNKAPGGNKHKGAPKAKQAPKGNECKPAQQPQQCNPSEKLNNPKDVAQTSDEAKCKPAEAPPSGGGKCGGSEGQGGMDEILQALLKVISKAVNGGGEGGAAAPPPKASGGCNAA